jgi:hypothetical protein
VVELYARKLACRAQVVARPGGFGDGAAEDEDVVVVTEDGGDLDGSADGLDVTGDGFDGGCLAALDPVVGSTFPMDRDQISELTPGVAPVVSS